LLTAFALYHAVAGNWFPDFYIYRAGAEIGLRGESPYDPAKIRERVAAQFPDNESLVANCGFFLPPQAIVAFAPFAAVPYPISKVLWALVTGLSAVGVLLVLRTFGTTPPTTLIGRLVPVFLLLNFLTVGVVMVGQTTLLFAGCVAAGQWCFERRWPLLGAVLWAIPFAKPHLALPLVPLAWYLGGWKRAAAVVAVVGVLNLAGCLIAGGSPLFLREYIDFLASGHKSVLFNRAELNPEITSWNRLLYVATDKLTGDGVLIEQTAWVTLGSYLVWFGLVVGRVALGGARPSPAWAAAAAAAGAVVCPQVLGYEALLLVIAVPWVRELFAGGWRLRGLAAVGTLLLEAAVSFQMASQIRIAGQVYFDFHRPLATVLFAALVLIGPVCPVRRDPKGSEH
jgi:hypothetical protein